MSINYPLELPAVPGFQSLALRMQGIVGLNASPFTGQQQTYEFPGEWWEADIALPPILDRGVAEQWFAFLAALRAQSGTFLLGDPLGRDPQGMAQGSPLMPELANLSQAQSKTLLVTGWETLVPRILCVGDYLEIGRNFLASPSAFSTWSTYAGTGATAPTVTSAATAGPGGSPRVADLIHFGATGAGVGSNSVIYQTAVCPVMAAGWPFNFGVWLKASAPATIYLGIYIGGLIPNVPDSPLECNVGTEWSYFSLPHPAQGAASPMVAFLYNPVSSPAVDIYAWGASLDDGLSRHRLHKVLTEQDSDGNGNATFDIFPRLRETLDEAAPVIVFGARGTFRLALGTQRYLRQISMDAARTYGFAFSAMEAF